MSEPGYVVMPLQGKSVQNISSQGAVDAVSVMKQSLDPGSGSQTRPDFGSTLNSHKNGDQSLGSRGPPVSNLGSRGRDSQGLPGINSRTGAEYREQEHAGPLKKAIANQDSLYRYLNWEDPVRTVGSYVGVLSLLFGLHYFPLTQLSLKCAATVLGIMSVATYAGQSFNPQTKTRLEARQYRRVPEDTLNATLRDIHDFIQYAVVEAQRILFGEDLTKTFAGFVGLTTLYWLAKILPAFWLSVVVVTSLYVSSLLLSPRGRAVAQEASARAGELASTAAEGGKQLAQDGKNQAARLSSQAQDTAADASRRTGNALQSGKQTVNEQANRAVGTASTAAGRTSSALQGGKESDAEQANRALGNTGLPQTNNNATVHELNSTKSNLNNTHDEISTTEPRSGHDMSNLGHSSPFGTTTTSIGNSGLGSTSSGLETPLETPGVVGDAAAARAYMRNSSDNDATEYTHTPDYGAIGGAYEGHDSVNTASANTLNTTYSPFDASKQGTGTPRYGNTDGNSDMRFDNGGLSSVGIANRTYTKATNSTDI